MIVTTSSSSALRADVFVSDSVFQRGRVNIHIGIVLRNRRLATGRRSHRSQYLLTLNQAQVTVDAHWRRQRPSCLIVGHVHPGHLVVTRTLRKPWGTTPG